jgi:hypothetical protein
MGGLIVCERIGVAFPDVVVIIAAKLLVVRQTRHRVRTRLQVVLIKVAARVSEFPTESVHPLFCRSPSPGFALCLRFTVRSQPIYGNGGHDNYGRGEKVSERKVNEIGVLYVGSSCAGLGYCT